MKKTVVVTQVRTLEIEIPDEILDEGAVERFSRHIFDIDSIDEIFEHAAYNIVNGNVGYTVDYIGLLGKKGQTFNGEKADTTFKEIDIYEEYEVN